MAKSTGTYTQHMLALLEENTVNAYDCDIDYNVLRSKINGDDYFRSFSARLLNFYNAKTGNSFSADDNSAAINLHQLMQEMNTNLERDTTLKNWFSGKTDPKISNDSRKIMFRIAFTLSLTVEETEDFFHKVFLDKAFNVRNADELIYKYCIKNSRPFSDAQTLISLIATSDHSGKVQNETRILNINAEQIVSDNELIEFINSHPADFCSKDSITAKRIQSVLLSELTGDENTTGLAEQYYYKYLGGREYGKNHRNLKSIDFMLDTLLYSGASSRRQDSDIATIRKAFTRKEIKNQFPNKDTLSKDTPTLYMRRKNIILLYFYKFWCSDRLSKYKPGTYESFCEELNNLLYECGFSPLYHGNPYDWIFLFCSACKDQHPEDCEPDDYLSPLDVFLDIIASE